MIGESETSDVVFSIQTRKAWSSNQTFSPLQYQASQPLHYQISPLILAVLAGNFSAVKLLLSNVDSPTQILKETDSLGRTPLVACIMGIDTLVITTENLQYASTIHPSHLRIFEYITTFLPPSTYNERDTLFHGVTPLILASYVLIFFF
ncbi:hypothetical protein HMI54_012573 [Coelomomyces lativittatus]|nr:hypothetical protein HMI54_012573 [Coelomomyces lativittatus]